MTGRPTGRRAVATLACVGGALWPRLLFAHAGRPIEPHDLWRAWTFEPAELVLLAVAAVAYGRGVRALWARAGAGRGVRRWEAGCYAAGLAALAVALVSPLHALGGALFSAHMAQHEVLMVVAAPLLALGRPLVPAAWALAPGARRAAGRAFGAPAVRRLWRSLSAPAGASLVHGAAVWAWHAPPLYARALDSEVVHALQHASFLGTGVLFWWAVLAPLRRRGRGAWACAAWIVFTMAHTSALGALLALSRHVSILAYARTTLPWGINALEDQQLAGLIMWIPGSVAYLAAALAVLGVALAGPARGGTASLVPGANRAASVASAGS